jgi:hypothetical protein
MSQIVALKEAVQATVPYPRFAGDLSRTILHFSKSDLPFNKREHLGLDGLKQSVLGSAFYPVKTILDTPLSEPYRQLELPTCPRPELRERPVFDDYNRVHGKLIQVPGLYVQANRILQNMQERNFNYNYEQAVGRMAFEAARLVSFVIRRGIFRVREHPGAMATLMACGDLDHDEMGISEEFAEELLRSIRREEQYRERFQQISDLDNFPIYGIRYPLANQHGIQSLYLRILPGRGRYVAANPWNLGLRYLGDEDGDLGFIILRAREVLEGRIEKALRPQVEVHTGWTHGHGHLSLDHALHPETLPYGEEVQKKLRRKELTTWEARSEWILDAMTRSHVSVYTTTIGWWCSRVLVQAGHSPQEAYRMGFQALEWFMEACMDARKGDSKFAGFDRYRLMNTLSQGGALDWGGLKSLGIPDNTLKILQTSWAASGGYLRIACAQSPVYNAVVLERRDMEHSIPLMLRALKEVGVQPEALYRTIVNDLRCVQEAVEPEPQFPAADGVDDPFNS